VSRRGVNKTTVHKGGGAEHVAYMTREEALREREHEREGRERLHERGGALEGTLGHEFDDGTLLVWNVPGFVTGEELSYDEEEHGKEEGRGRAKGSVKHEITDQVIPLKEKVENVKTYLGGKLEMDEALGGPTHHRTVLTVGGETRVKDLKPAVVDYLKENYPGNPALVAFHRDTKHLHAHVLIPTRRLDGRRLDLGQRFFKLDESWMKIAAHHFKDPDIYKTHFIQKAETKAWKERFREALRDGAPIPPKPDRHRDHWEVWNSFKPHDDFWVGRVRHRLKTHGKKLEYLREAGAQGSEVERTRQKLALLREKYDAAAEKRAGRVRAPEGSRTRAGRARRGGAMPPEIPTVNEVKEIKHYTQELKRLRTERLKRCFAEAVEEYKLSMLPADVRQMTHDLDKFDGRVRELAGALLAAAEKGVDLRQTSLDAEGVREYARYVLAEEIDREDLRRRELLRAETDRTPAEAQRADRVGRAMGVVLFDEVRCKFQEELAARGKAVEPALARYDLNVARERLEVAREQTNRPGLKGEARPLLTEDKEFLIGRMLEQIDDRDFRKTYREKLANTRIIDEKVHERVRGR
jgi:hypothetical protein